MAAAAGRRLQRAQDFLTEFHSANSLAFGFRLWDGSLAPAGLGADALRMAFDDEAVIGEIVRRPSLRTILRLHDEGRIAIENGTLIDFERVRPRGSLAKLFRALPVGRTLALGAAFLTARTPAAVAADRRKRHLEIGSSQADIAFHYDVSDDFYRLFLDERMVYTCAYFTEWHDDLDRAQRDKLDLVCRKLRLKPGDSMLDIGCGWGALTCHAVTEYGVRAHAVTLSENQVAEARRRIAALGIGDRATVELRSYADVTGRFDKIAAIGVFEHIGLRNHAAYLAKVHSLLAPRGLYLHHAISRWAKDTDRRFRKPTTEMRWLGETIFPGGELDHIGMTAAGLQRAGFEVHDVEALREHYQLTTQIWHDRLHARRAEAEAMVGAEVTRKWLLYLAGVSVLFERSAIGIFQTLASRKRRGPSGLPPTRADLYRA